MHLQEWRSTRSKLYKKKPAESAGKGVWRLMGRSSGDDKRITAGGGYTGRMRRRDCVLRVYGALADQYVRRIRIAM